MSKATKARGNPLSKYSPVRFANARRDFLDEAVETCLSEFGSGVRGVFSTDQQKLKKIFKLIGTKLRIHIQASRSFDLYSTGVRELHEQAMRHVILRENAEAEIGVVLLGRLVEAELRIVRHYASFIQSGSNIFEFPQELLNLFWETDVDDVLLEEIHLPFSTIYLHFGQQAGKKLCGTLESFQLAFQEEKLPSGVRKPVELLLEGAYVSQCPDSSALNIILMGVPKLPHKYSDNCIDCYEESVNQQLPAPSKELTAGTALAPEPTNLSQHQQTWVEQAEVKYNLSTDVLEAATHRVKLYKDTALQQFVDCLKLVINCLLYLQSYPEDAEEDYPLEAPRNLVAQAKRGSPMLAQVAEQKLSQLGFRRIKFCGRSRKPFEHVEAEPTEEVSLLAISSPTIKTRRSLYPHKRRAHRRKQRYGKGLKSWRFVWIRETMIHPEKYQQTQNLYRIYEVVPEDSKP